MACAAKRSERKGRHANKVAAWSVISAAVLVFAQFAWAHGAHAREGHDGPWWTMWNLRPEVLIVLGGIALLYWRGIAILWSRAGDSAGISRRQVWTFAAGMTALLAALVSPIDVIAEELNSVHMVQHMLLIKVAAPLLIIGSAGQAMVWALPGSLRVRLARAVMNLRSAGVRGYFLWQPLVTWLSFALVLWVLHIPLLYEAALHDRFLHDLQHIAFLVSACIFWRVLLDPFSRMRMSAGLGVLYLFSTTLHASALGTFMIFSSNVWYTDYKTSTLAWNVQPLMDQHLAGYIMWMPACIIYAGAAAVLFGLWLQNPVPRGRRVSKAGRTAAVADAPADGGDDNGGGDARAAAGST